MLVACWAAYWICCLPSLSVVDFWLPRVSIEFVLLPTPRLRFCASWKLFYRQGMTWMEEDRFLKLLWEFTMEASRLLISS